MKKTESDVLLAEIYASEAAGKAEGLWSAVEALTERGFARGDDAYDAIVLLHAEANLLVSATGRDVLAAIDRAIEEAKA